MTVAFIYWGSHELLDLLTRKEHRGRVHFWFGIEAFDDAWFAARLEESLRTAGPRYTPALHIELPIALEFEAFGRTGAFISREKKQARELRKRLSAVLNPKAPVDSVVGAAMNKISSKVQVVLEGLAALDAQPIGTLPFKSLAKQASVAAQAVGEMEHLLQERQREPTKPLDVSNTRAPEPANSGTAFRDREYELHRLSSPLRAICESANQADASAGSNLMLLRGVAGVGKTHLLCDVARQRLDAKRPTVLLMGQRFISQDAPWTQALQQLDLPALSAEEFIGALEAAAQAANARALVMIDALNEGAGRAIWPTHLNAFLAPLERSEWVGVVLAVRSSYEDVVVPEEVRARARQVTHEGFTEHEYDAAKAFFLYYQLELPSTPLLAPEFRNPLFLKTLCRGLHDKGERRLPRGMQGITAVFDLYFDAVNKSLAARLDFDPRERLVRRALDAIVSLFAESDESWIALSKAKEAVDAFLPGRDFEHSLYRGLVTEGVLVEEVGTGFGSAQVEVVFVGYERMSDHLAARALLDRHLDVREPSRAFAVGGPLAFVCDDKRHARVGLLEALCIQVPERTSQELLEVAPACASIWGIGEAFRQSIVWRSHAAFTEATRKMLNELSGSVQEILDVLLTVATVPGHPMNALSLDRRLRKDTMADRDAWWSVYLHDARGNRGAVDRLVDWASAQSSTNAIDEDAVDLSALVLAWMFTSSNRFLRDRSTTALVSILTGRLPAAVRLFERFVEVDDPYVAERVCAVAYGVAMRSRDAAAVGSLAECIYKHVFSSGNPPAHILLRDYARGVIERALYLGS
jgi:hypothetical protein